LNQYLKTKFKKLILCYKSGHKLWVGHQSVKTKKEEEPEKQQPTANAGSNSSAFVKVSMDGAPYLREVDLNMYSSYKDLSIALKKMFSTFTTGKSSVAWEICTL
jgi:hypothetical protein